MEKRIRPLLFERFPGLREKIPWTGLGLFPTPVERMKNLEKRLACSSLFIKRDDLSGERYGGNKVRKLEFTLAQAKEKNQNPVITVGAVGSNHVLATTIYARELGLRTIGIFVPQPVQEYARRNLLANLRLGCGIEYVESEALAPLRAARVYLREWRKNGTRPYLLWAGGSSALGVLGYVDAALEIADQVKKGLMPEPDFIFAAVGSAGTYAGLFLGLKLAGLRSRAVGVRVYDRTFANEHAAAFLARRALNLMRSADPDIPELSLSSREAFILHDYFGRGYASFTRKGVQAVRLLEELEGVHLEGTYTGKAMAAFIDFMKEPERRERTGLFINTYNSRPLENLVSLEPPRQGELPAPLRRYFDEEVEPVKD